MSQQNLRKKILFDSLFTTVATVVDKLFFFVINLIIARYLSKEGFGEYSTALGFATFFSLFSNMGIGPSSIRAINIDPEHQNEHFTNSIIVKSTLSLITFIIMFIAVILTDYNINTIILTIIFGLVRIGNEYLLSFYSIFDAKAKFIKSSFYTAAFAFILLISTILVVLLKGNYFSLAISRLVVVLIFLWLSLREIFKIFQIRFNIFLLKDFIFKTIPFSLSMLFGSFTMNFSTLLVPLFNGTVYAGIFNNAYIFFTSILFLPNNISKILLPHLYKHNIQNEKPLFQSTYNLYMKLFSIMSFYISIIFFLYSDKIIYIIFGAKYADSVQLLKYFAFAIPFAFNASGTFLTVLDNQKINTKVDFIVFIFNIPIAFFLIKKFGVIGAVYAVIISNSLNYILSNFLLINIYKMKYFNIFVSRILLGLTVLILVLFHKNILLNFNFIISLVIISFFYLFLVLIFFVRKKEYNIIKELFKK